MAGNLALGRRSKALGAGKAEPRGERPHIAVIGFMGAGKTTVGRLVAERAGLEFVDLDDTIAKQAGESITKIFRDHGEVGFRACERAAIREVLAHDKPTVIATGGGTFADPSMRAWILQAARTVFLRVSADVLVERVVAGDERNKRPLLKGPDPDATVRRLLAERTPAYEQCEFTVSADGRGKDELVEEILHLLGIGSAFGRSTRRHSWSETRAPVATHEEAARASAGKARPVSSAPSRDSRLVVQSGQGAYVVEVRAEAGDWIAHGIAELCAGARIGLISDTTVSPLHARLLARDLTALGKNVTVCALAPGEEHKSLTTAAALYERLLAAGLTRGDAIVAVGGGVVGDVAGFVAATLLRGLAYIQVPTTTLAAVDASIGGKNGLNTARGKNLVGTIHAPRGVFVAASHLSTQHRRIHASGLVEVVKMAAALDAELFALLQHEASRLLDANGEALTAVVRRAVALKAHIVGRDEHDQGDRAILNFGHTVGHAIEAGEHFSLLHGEAVSLGMMAELSWAESRGLSHAVASPLRELLIALEQPTDFGKVAVDLEALQRDKKGDGENVRLPVVSRLGTCVVQSVAISDLIDYLRPR